MVPENHFRFHPKIAVFLAGVACLSCINTSKISAAEKLDKSTAQRILYQLKAATEENIISGTYNIEENFAGQLKRSQWQIYVWPDNRAVYQLQPGKDDSVGMTFVRKGEKLYFKKSSEKNRHFTRRGQYLRYRRQRLFIDVDLLCENYQIELDSGPLYSGRPTQSLTITSNLEMRPAMAILFDPETKVILRAETNVPTDSGGFYSRRQYWQDIATALPDSTIFHNASNEATEAISRPGKSRRFRNLTGFLAEYRHSFLLPATLPKGFQLHSVRKLRHHKHEIVHFLYTDGLSTISLFEEPSGKHHKRGKKPVWSPLNFLHGDKQNIGYRVMSELPESELLLLEKSLFVIEQNNKIPGAAWLIGITGFVVGVAGFGLAFSYRRKFLP